jgi:hypothetical protein
MQPCSTRRSGLCKPIQSQVRAQRAAVRACRSHRHPCQLLLIVAMSGEFGSTCSEAARRRSVTARLLLHFSSWFPDTWDTCCKSIGFAQWNRYFSPPRSSSCCRIVDTPCEFARPAACARWVLWQPGPRPEPGPSWPVSLLWRAVSSSWPEQRAFSHPRRGAADPPGAALEAHAAG